MSEGPPNEWAELLEVARHQVVRAGEGDYLAAVEIVTQSAIALRGLLRHDDLPDPYRKVFLEALLTSLERIERGGEPIAALNLQRPAHRIKDPNTGVRDVLMFVQVGQELDHILSSGAGSKTPVADAIQAVAKKNKLTVAKVKKVWADNGSRAAWEEIKSEWK